MPEAHARAGEDQQSTNPQRRGFVLLGRHIELFVPDQEFHQQQKRPRANEANQRRNQKGYADLFRLYPIHAFAELVTLGQERVRQTYAHDGADQGVRAGRGQAEVPGAQVPDDGGCQEREDHSEAGARSDIEHQFHGKQSQHAKRDGAARS